MYLLDLYKLKIIISYNININLLFQRNINDYSDILPTEQLVDIFK